GLPPGPIGNPGEASLRAAIHPAETNYLYFVANTRGGHFFSATLAEHNKNVVKRSEEHTSELQSRVDLVCRLLLEKKKKKINDKKKKHRTKSISIMHCEHNTN